MEWQNVGTFSQSPKNMSWKVLVANCIDTEQLQTIITEIKAKQNDRPIKYVKTNLNDSESLTPSHFLQG